MGFEHILSFQYVRAIPAVTLDWPLAVVHITGKTAFCFLGGSGAGRGNRLQSCPMMGC